ncbi:protein of unknown function (plasmid) [Rhodovastum atsumiense]|nr:protein of unknown function [Rhodovastum atsumiense]
MVSEEVEAAAQFTLAFGLKRSWRALL